MKKIDLRYKPKYLRSMPSNCSPKKFINFIKNLYKKNVSLKSTKKIPYIIHQIWLGPNLPPNDYISFQESFKKKHPKWKLVLWNEKKINQYSITSKLFNKKLFDQSYNKSNFAKASDILRYEILYRFGGLYIDYDCKCFKNFETLHNRYDFYAGLENINNGLLVGNATIGCIPKHPILKQCLINIKKYENKKINLKYWKGYTQYTAEDEEKYATTLVTTGPILFTKSVWQLADKTNYIDIIFPSKFFYPWAENKKFPIKKETFSCHLFKGSWKKI